MMTTEHKRNLVRQEINLVSVSPKRPGGNLSFSTKERKEKIGEKIAALQQLVSPYGKTDTASVLHEAMEYIIFLHDQVKVLSAPYLMTGQPTKMQKWDSCGLRSRGLCIMPLSCTDAVTSSNGADIWAPIKTTSPKI